jgi:hypothetical protein
MALFLFTRNPRKSGETVHGCKQTGQQADSAASPLKAIIRDAIEKQTLDHTVVDREARRRTSRAARCDIEEDTVCRGQSHYHPQ